jgi:hypothetical protein
MNVMQADLERDVLSAPNYFSNKFAITNEITIFAHSKKEG